jgi:hypothetical protein
LLVEICFENTTNYLSSMVRATSMQYHKYFGTDMRDLASACTAFQSPIFVAYRPNVCFKIEPITNINDPGIHSVNFKLSQNYPNPFNPETRISFEIPKRGFASLRIYDILGREVKILVNEIKTAGAYSVDFNAANLPSGIYLYRLDCSGYAETKRMILLK